MMRGSEIEEDFLPEHTISMRKAWAYCQELIEKLTSTSNIDDLPSLPAITVLAEVEEWALTIQNQREDALVQFWSEKPPHIPVIDLRSSSATFMTAYQFRQRFQNANLPCLIQGMDKTNFSFVCSQWRYENAQDNLEGHGTIPKRRGSKARVNKTWFLKNVGKETKVPVRYQPSSSQALLDEDGRSMECETTEMTMEEWIRLVENSDEAYHTPCLSNPESSSTSEKACDFYLKDWHLQSHLRATTTKDTPTVTMEQSIRPCYLYHVPPHFQYDLLNSFLTRFTDLGDYKFVYWGPAGSKTSLHSDVMNSFSWSFNVAGRKEWKFYPPIKTPSSTCTHGSVSAFQPQASSDDPLIVIQQAGECIFVPCGWQHEVTNLEETLAINHNWITTANIDQTWDCMCVEMKAIEAELEAWGLDGDDARESMLRGCFGLDVTAFFFMLLTRILEILVDIKDYRDGATPIEYTKDQDEDKMKQLHFDAVRLKQALQNLIDMTDEKLADTLRLQNRLNAVLQLEISATEIIKVALWATAAVKSEPT